MPKVKMAVARERRVRVLSVLSVRGAQSGSVVLSLKALAVECGLTDSQVRSVLRALKEAGCVQVMPRLLPNGGSAENAYRVTARGSDVIRAASAEARAALATTRESEAAHAGVEKGRR